MRTDVGYWASTLCPDGINNISYVYKALVMIKEVHISVRIIMSCNIN